MEKLNQLSDFIGRVASDERLKPTHVALYMAFCHTWIANNCHHCYNVSRRRLMRMSRIKSKSTYHKAISELVDMEYISYRPSYHPKGGSKVTLLAAQW